MKKLMGMFFLVLFLSSCGGELSYKQGATANDLSRTKKLCESERIKSDAEINQCLEKNGWSVHQLDDLDLFAVASVNPNNQNPQVSKDKLLIEEPATAKASSNPIETQPSNANKSTENNVKAPTPSKPTSELDIYVVSSWWKMGSNRATLEKNMDECVATLGEAHKPNPITQQVTRGLVVCMYEKGWKALKVK